MPKVGETYADKDRHRWTIRGIKPPKGRDAGFVNLVNARGDSLTLSWPSADAVLEKSPRWRFYFGDSGPVGIQGRRVGKVGS